MARTTPDLVKAIIDVPRGRDVTPFIGFATALVDDQCLLSGYDDTRLEQIERYLAAHFLSLSFNRTVRSNAVSGAADQGFDPVETDYDLRNTVYGQQAILLDTAGNLAALTNTMKVVKKALPSGRSGFRWLGSAEWLP